MNNNNMSTMEPVFCIMALFELVRVAWGGSVGMKLREMKQIPQLTKTTYNKKPRQ